MLTEAEWAGLNIDEFPHVKKWLFTLLERPGFEKGRNVPTPHTSFEHYKMTDEELDQKAEASRNWVQKGMAADAKK